MPSSAALYVPFFGLAREPFSIAPDPHFLFMSEMHREALAHLLWGVSGGGGFVLLTGEIGAGKTTVCRCFLEQVPADCNVAYIVNPKLSVIELLKTVCDEFGVGLPERGSSALAPTVKDYLDPLNRYVLDAFAAGRHNVLVIDEAQSLSAEVLEQLRLLTNLETAERKLLQIVLIGQPELRNMLAQPGLEQLAQRVIARYHLPALSMAETALYVQHRLAVAGLRGEGPFDGAALRRIHKLTGGVPRRINLLCGRAMLGAYAHGRARIGRRVVEQAAREVFDSGLPAAAGRGRWLAAGLLAGAGAVALAGWWVLSGQAGGRGGVAPAVAASAPSPASAAVTASAAATQASAASTSVVSAAAASAAIAPAAAASAAAAVLPASAAVAIADEPLAWRELAAVWDLSLAAGDPCVAAARQQVQCFRGSGGLALIRQLDRPGIVTLRDGDGPRAYALLVGLGADSVNLRLAGGRLQTVPLAELARLWRGDFATFWRTPPGFEAGRVGPPSAALADWLAPRLPPAPPAPTGGSALPRDEVLRAQVQAFQLAQGIKPDGLAGPLTVMLVNRASGVAEPRLLPER